MLRKILLFSVPDLPLCLPTSDRPICLGSGETLQFANFRKFLILVAKGRAGKSAQGKNGCVKVSAFTVVLTVQARAGQIKFHLNL